MNFNPLQKMFKMIGKEELEVNRNSCSPENSFYLTPAELTQWLL
jgi:hypothetical protein